MNRFYSILVFVFAFCVSVFAQINTDRPNQTDSSSTLPEGSFQMESGVAIGYHEGFQSQVRTLVVPINLLRYGLTERIELRVINQLLSIDNGFNKIQGIEDLEIGAKFQLFKKPESHTEVAALFHLIVPSATDGLRNEDYGTLTKLIVSHAFEKGLSLSYNLGYLNQGVKRGDLTYSLSFGKSVTDKLSLFLEPYGALAEGKEMSLYFDSGFTYLLKNNIQLDLVFGTGVTEFNNFMSIGFSWMIQKREE